MKPQNVFLLEPAAILKPWGLRSRRIKEVTGCTVGVGEIWLASAQEGPGNVSNRIPSEEHVTLAQVLAEAEQGNGERRVAMLGRKAVEELASAPFRGKTEAWYIRKAVGQVGIVSGPHSQENMDWVFEQVKQKTIPAKPTEWSDRLREALGVIEPVEEGNGYLVKPGTVHTMFAVGEGSYMIIDEIQQGYGDGPLPTLSKILLVENSVLSLQLHPSDQEVAQNQKSQDLDVQDLATNPTVRLYDFERDRDTDVELGYRVARPGDGLTQPRPVAYEQDNGVRVEVLVIDTHFVKEKVQIPAGGSYQPTPEQDSYRILHCADGQFVIETGTEELTVRHGQTAFLCASAERSTVHSARGALIIQDFYPNLESYVAYLKSLGTRLEGDMDMLQKPPAALQV